MAVNSLVGNTSTRQLVAECNEDLSAINCLPNVYIIRLLNVPHQLISMIGRLMWIIVMLFQSKAFWQSFKLNGFSNIYNIVEFGEYKRFYLLCWPVQYKIYFNIFTTVSYFNDSIYTLPHYKTILWSWQVVI